MTDILHTLLSINLEDNKQIGPIVVVFAIIVIVVLIIVAKVLGVKDKLKEKSSENIETTLHKDRVITNVEKMSKKAEPHEKRSSR